MMFEALPFPGRVLVALLILTGAGVWLELTLNAGRAGLRRILRGPHA